MNEQNLLSRKETSPRKHLSIKEMFDLSRKKWGLDFQLLMLVEELNELAVATLHLMRKVKNETISDQAKNVDKFAEEIADVEFMLAEMKYYYNNVNVIAWHRKEKETRLKELLSQ